MRSLRVQLALLGFAAIYIPVLLLLGVTVVTEDEQTLTVDGREAVVTDTDRDRSPWVTGTVLALGPAAAALAWWWAGRAVRPIDQVRAVAEDIEGTDLGRRIGLDRGPTEVEALAASFDAMLDRLERTAETQRRLIEETSHELRNPLAVLLTNTDVLLAHPDPTLDVYREGLERSKAAAQRLQGTIDELLVDARGRARAIDRQPVDLAALVRSLVDEAVVLHAPDHLLVPIDEATVRRAVANLLDNARRYSVGVEVDVEADDGVAAVTVTDHGPGIPAEQQERIFERFWRARPDAGGTGLGLPIARQVALAHGGDLTVTSPGPAGDGAAFRLTLAVAEC